MQLAHFRLAPLAPLALALFAACQAVPGAGGPDGGYGAEGAIAVRPAIRDGRAYAVQAVVSPNTAGTVAGVTVTLSTVAAGVESSPIATSPTLAPAAFATPLVFSHLKLNTTYRVRGTAYDAGAAVISVPSPSYVDVAVTNDAAPTMGTLPIQLTDVTFDATATAPGGVAFTPGAVVNASASPSISQ